MYRHEKSLVVSHSKFSKIQLTWEKKGWSIVLNRMIGIELWLPPHRASHSSVSRTIFATTSQREHIRMNPQSRGSRRHRAPCHFWCLDCGRQVTPSPYGPTLRHPRTAGDGVKLEDFLRISHMQKECRWECCLRSTLSVCSMEARLWMRTMLERKGKRKFSTCGCELMSFMRWVCSLAGKAANPRWAAVDHCTCFCPAFWRWAECWMCSLLWRWDDADFTLFIEVNLSNLSRSS